VDERLAGEPALVSAAICFKHKKFKIPNFLDNFDLAIGGLKSKRPNEVFPILRTVRHYADPNFR
jgi:hypothetical protein